MLTDAFGRTIDYLRVSVTTRCNLNCVYCGKQDCEKKDAELTVAQIETLVLLADYMVARSKMKEKKRFKITAFMTVILILMYISCLMIECLLMFRYHTNIDLRLDLALISRILYCFAFIGATVCLMFPGPKKKKKDPKKNNRGTLEKNKDIVELVG